ncbi:unnamed protein product [Mytilus edulis]|uniref:Uncharacterized protein n=1 Tax=Mytilus edulis TaxID=6550 RepID=A0A8S3VL47_MYTED|nr:unnamed protein product [Mytilus edulis]
MVVGSQCYNGCPYEYQYYGIVMVFESVKHFIDQTPGEMDEKPLFSKILDDFIPDRIISTKDNDYCLIVRETIHERKKIARFSHTFEFKWIYDGCCKHGFNPIDLTETPTMLICVVDNYDGGAIHVLNKDGDVLTCNLFAKEEVADPLSVYATVTGMLLIGCEKNKKNELAQINLFKLK